MNEKQTFNRFTDFETANATFSKSYNGVYYWDRIRCQVFSEIAEKAGIWSTNNYSFEKQRVDKNLMLTGFTKGIDSLRSLPDSPLFTGSRDVLFAAANTSRRQHLDGTYWDVLVDPLADRIKYSYTSLESKSKLWKECSGNIRTKDTTATDQIQFISNIGRTLGRNVTIEHSAADDIRLLENKIKEIFDVDINIIGRVESELTQRKYTKPLYELLLKQVDPDIVLIRYNPSKSTLIEVCREFGIPVVELQHGVDFEHSLSISYDTPVEGKLHFPDVYFSWGEYWSDKPNFPINDIRVVGWPFLEYLSENYFCREDGQNVLFISQPDCGKELSKIAVDIAEGTDWKTIFRLHPKERGNWKSIYPWLEPSDIRVDHGDEALYEVMNNCWAQIGTESTALYEGIKFNLNTFIYNDFDPASHPWRKIDEIPVFSNSTELKNQLKKGKGSGLDTSQFFKPNSMKNIQHEIEDII